MNDSAYDIIIGSGWSFPIEVDGRGGIKRSRGAAEIEQLVTGEADLAIQQISELKQVGGIDVVGPIPYELQTPAVFSAGRMAATNGLAEADRLLRFLASPEVAPALRDSGLEP